MYYYQKLLLIIDLNQHIECDELLKVDSKTTLTILFFSWPLENEKTIFGVVLSFSDLTVHGITLYSSPISSLPFIIVTDSVQDRSNVSYSKHRSLGVSHSKANLE